MAVRKVGARSLASLQAAERPSPRKRAAGATSKTTRKKTGATSTRKRAGADTCVLSAEVEEQVSKVLMELMCASESDAVRVSAAKALMEHSKRNTRTEESDDEQAGKDERCEAIAEIRRIMGELADAKLGGGAGPAEMDTDGASGPADAQG